MIEKPGLGVGRRRRRRGHARGAARRGQGRRRGRDRHRLDREGELIGHEALEILRGDALKVIHDKPEKKKKAKASASGRGKAATEPPAAPLPEKDGGDRTSRRCCPPRRSTAISACATRPSRRRRSRPPSPSPPRSTSTSPKRRTRAQDIDLIWGAVLTRFMSLASYRYGSDYLSVGRVQSPTLRPSSTASSSAAPSCRCRTGSSRRRWSATATSSRWRTPRAASARSTKPTPALGHCAGRAGDRHRLQGAAAPGRAAATVQHYGADERGLRLPASRRPGRCALPSRCTSTGSSATRAPITPSTRPRWICAAASRSWRAGNRSRRPRPASPSRASSRPRAARSAPPTTRRLPGGGA